MPNNTDALSAAIIARRHLLLHIIAAVNEMLMAEVDEPELMRRICQALVQDQLFCMAWIGKCAESGTQVQPIAQAGLAEGYLEKVAILCDDSPQGRGPTGTAIRENKTVINTDTDTNPLFEPWRALARTLGFRSSAATPIRQHHRVVGALNVYSTEAQAFGPDEVLLLEKLATDLGLAMERREAERALRESAERYRLISSVANDLLYSCIRGPGDQFGIDWATSTVDRIFGYSLQEIIELGCWRSFVHPDDLPIFDAHITQLGPGQSSTCEMRIIAKDGAVRYIRANARVTEEVDEHARHRLYGSCQDITEQKRAEMALRESEARFRAMAEQSVDWVWSIDTSGRHFFTNQRGVDVLGYSVDEFLSMDPTALVHPDDMPIFRETFATALAKREGWRHCALRWRCRDGSYRVFESNAAPLFDEDQRLIGFQGVDRDITDRKQAEERIEFMAHHDALTGLPNRILLQDRFELAQHQADRDKKHVAMLFLDLDNFKIVNDTLGHVAGDKLLQEVVARIIKCMRDTDTVCRLGGDEFILLLNDVPDSDAVERVAGDVLAQMIEPVKVDGHILSVSCSIGVSLYPEDGKDFTVLLQKADAAMYNAKEAGRNTYRFFSAAMNQRAQEHLLLQSRLHQALSRGEFSLAYQPQLDIGTGRVFGVEALLRWYSPDLGQVPPGRFIPVAEDSGFIVQIGAWVLEEACRQVRAWQDAGLPELSVAVNLSALQFRRGNLAETVAVALRASGLAPHLLELELTESMLLQDVEHTLATVRQLKALGVRLAIDDFGTGYSSLSYLKRFTVDKLKIDQSFVRDIGTDPDDAAIVRAIIQMARSLRLGIIAEGVENAEQMEFLTREGCEEIQGYYFSHPLAAENLRAFLRGQGTVHAH